MSKKMFTTQVNISKDVRIQMCGLIDQQLADLFDLYSQTKQAHWNVKGSYFISLHKLYDDLAGELEEFADVLAERIASLGGLASGSVKLAAKASRLPEIPLEMVDGIELTKALVKNYGLLANSTREATKVCAEVGDDDTADMCTELSRALDKALWFLEAHVQI